MDEVGQCGHRMSQLLQLSAHNSVRLPSLGRCHKTLAGVSSVFRGLSKSFKKDTEKLDMPTRAHQHLASEVCGHSASIRDLAGRVTRRMNPGKKAILFGALAVNLGHNCNGKLRNKGAGCFGPDGSHDQIWKCRVLLLALLQGAWGAQASSAAQAGTACWSCPMAAHTARCLL